VFAVVVEVPPGLVPLLFESRRMSTMPKKIDDELKARRFPLSSRAAPRRGRSAARLARACGMPPDIVARRGVNRARWRGTPYTWCGQGAVDSPGRGRRWSRWTRVRPLLAKSVDGRRAGARKHRRGRGETPGDGVCLAHCRTPCVLPGVRTRPEIRPLRNDASSSSR